MRTKHRFTDHTERFHINQVTGKRSTIRLIDASSGGEQALLLTAGFYVQCCTAWVAGPVLREAAECDDDEDCLGHFAAQLIGLHCLPVKEVKAICMNPSLVINGSSWCLRQTRIAMYYSHKASGWWAQICLMQ